MSESATPLRTFDDALAEWVRRNVRGANPIVGSVEFIHLAAEWDGCLSTGISVDFKETYRPKRGKIAGKWRYGAPVERLISFELPNDTDMMQVLRDIYEILAEDSTKNA